MAPLPVIGNIFRVAINWVGPSGLTAASVLHVRGDMETDADVYNGVSAAGHVAMLGACASTLNGVSTTITKLDGTSGASVWPAPLWASGAGSGEAIAQAANIISFGTGLRGPAHRGRVFLPFVAEGEQQAGFIAGTRVATVQTAWEDFVTALDSDHDLQLAVASYKHATAADVTSLVCRNVVGTQKRRVDRQRS